MKFLDKSNMISNWSIGYGLRLYPRQFVDPGSILDSGGFFKCLFKNVGENSTKIGSAHDESTFDAIFDITNFTNEDSGKNQTLGNFLGVAKAFDALKQKRIEKRCKSNYTKIVIRNPRY